MDNLAIKAKKMCIHMDPSSTCRKIFEGTNFSVIQLKEYKYQSYLIKENGYKLSDSHNGTNVSAMVLKVWSLQASSENMLKNTSSLAVLRPTESQILEGYARNPCFKKHST